MINRLMRYAFVALLLTLTGCATGQALTYHQFSFDARRESPNVEILDYRYGNSRQPGARPSQDALKSGAIPQSANISGEMLRGDALYVKWRLKSSGEIFEDTVDLASLLPANIDNQHIHFLVKGRQLYVYLISPERRPDYVYVRPDPIKSALDSDPMRMYEHLKVIVIYPPQRK